MSETAGEGWSQEQLFVDRPRSEGQPGRARAGRAPSIAALPWLIDISQLAAHLGVQVRHVRRLVAEDRIPYLKWGHLLHFDPMEIQEWLDRSRVGQR